VKKLQILMLCFFCGNFLNAQEVFKPSTHLGIHSGFNFSAVSFNPSLKQDLLRSNAFGIVLRHVSEPNIGLQLEINFAGKGWKEVIDSVGTYTRRLETLDIPILAAFIAGKRTVRFAFTIGPYVSYLRHEKETINIEDPDKYRRHYNKLLVNSWEFGFTGGVAFEFHTKLGTFALRASYNHGLTNIFPLDVDEFYFSGSRQQVIHGGLMYFVTF